MFKKIASLVLALVMVLGACFALGSCNGGKDGIKAEITLPDGVEGTFVWNGKEQILKSGKNTISL